MCMTYKRVVDAGLAGYLKVYQLSKPQIMGYDCLLIDEAQDLTPGLLLHYKTNISQPSLPHTHTHTHTRHPHTCTHTQCTLHTSLIYISVRSHKAFRRSLFSIVSTAPLFRECSIMLPVLYCPCAEQCYFPY